MLWNSGLASRREIYRGRIVRLIGDSVPYVIRVNDTRKDAYRRLEIHFFNGSRRIRGEPLSSSRETIPEQQNWKQVFTIHVSVLTYDNDRGSPLREADYRRSVGDIKYAAMNRIL